ncbi:MAG: hypothetical protein SGILL_008476 [Bacillariaceae sp.]
MSSNLSSNRKNPPRPHSSQQQESDNFQARPSRSLGRNAPGVAQADGSSWQEYLAVCEIQEKLQVRSYFENLTTGKRVWDEPPSGASHIIPATEEMRRMATMQLDDLYVATMANGSGDNGSGGDQNNDSKNKGSNKSDDKKKMGGIKSLFKFGKKDKDSNANPKETKIQYRPGSNLLATVSGENGSGSRTQRTDRHLQAAIAQSLAESSGVASGSSFQHQPDFSDHPDSDLAKAMALSLNESAGMSTSASPDAAAASAVTDDEDEILRRVLEQSKLEAAK